MLTQPCHTLSGIGPTLTEKLAKCGIHTVQDLLFHLPFRYQDRTRITPIQDLRPNDWAVITGRVCKVEVSQGRRSLLTCYVEDKTGILVLRFFHFNRQQVTQLKASPHLRAFGEVRLFSQRLEMTHPEYQLLDTETEIMVEETLTPIYPSTQGLSQTRLRQLIKKAIITCEPVLQTLEWMSNEQQQHLGVQSMASAIEHLHHPAPDTLLHTLENGSHPALKRLAFDELLAQRLGLQLANQHRAKRLAPAFTSSITLINRFLSLLPFSLTTAQQQVFQDIQHDLTQPKPMLRLVQGDVGSGKTVIAALAALQAIDNGYQVALMAPTDLLSEQHAHTLEKWLQPLGLTVYRLSGQMKTKARKETLAALASHQCQLIVGTHALFQDNVPFAQLGLIIIDEQHRFGVEQRLLLQQKGENEKQGPHQLLLTATPIPRTLAMTHYAHLDISIINELPPGRIPIITAVLPQEKRAPIITRLKAALASGRQAYWVCTLIDESEKLQCLAATTTQEELQEQLPNVRIGLIHGRMKAQEKEETMAAFKHGDIHLLVATTVIEVGVDVPNASLMIIENSERLGLSQLHQLRGRIGRGSASSHCLLLYQSPLSVVGRERLHVMRQTNDGFLIAEKDLQLRGQGELLGTKQTGYRTYKIASLPRDEALLPEIATAAQRLLHNEPITAQALTQRWLKEFEPFLQG